MKSLLIATALIEGITGLGMAIVPSLIVSLLLGIPLTDPGAVLIGRLAGAALLTIAVACLLSRNNSVSNVMIKPMIGYNIFSVTLLVYAALSAGISGPALWPAVLLHLALLGWCLSSIGKLRPKVRS